MGIFNEPKRLAKLLASLNTHSPDRPLSPIETAQWLKEGVSELGSREQVMKRVGIAKSMWSAFERVLEIPPEFSNRVCWGKSNPETMEIGFSTAHYLAEGLKKDEMVELEDGMWYLDRPYAVDELKKIKSYYKSNPQMGIKKAIDDIMKLNRPPKKNIIFIFISGLEEDTYIDLKQRSEEERMPLDGYIQHIFSQCFGNDAIIDVRVRPKVIRIAFSREGEMEIKKMLRTDGIDRNNIVEYILKRKVIA